MSDTAPATAGLRLALLASTLCLPIPLRAQGSDPAEPSGPLDDGTIVVAGKREEPLADVPGSVSVVSADQLEASGWKTLRDASAAVPNLLLTEFSSRRLSFPFVRGIGAGQGDPAVITYVDGVPQFGFGGTNLPLFDVARVEFLRGPQGTLYGRNALGGLMQVVTRPPSHEGQLEARVGLGDFDAREYAFSASGPLGGGGTLGRFGAHLSMRDGYTRNDFTGNRVDDRDSVFARGQVYFPSGSDSLARLSLFGERSRDGGFVLSDLDGLRAMPHRIDQDFEGVAERDNVSPTFTWERFGRNVEVTSISAFQHWEVLETSDFDFSPLDAVRRRTEESQDYFYQELRLASADGAAGSGAGDSARSSKEIEWVAGISGFLVDGEQSAANDFRPGGEGIVFPVGGVGVSRSAGDFEDVGVGIFGQATWAATDALELTAGLRYDYESKSADLEQTFAIAGTVVSSTGEDLDEDFDELLPHAGASYELADDVRLYGKASKGFKAGGFNLSAPPGSTAFGPETSWTYEVGTKVDWGEDADLSAALFYVDWDDMQLSQFDATTGGFVQNAGESTSMGVELELRADLSEELEVYSAAGYVDTEFESFVDPFGVDVSGNSLPFAPEETWSVGARYRTDLTADLELFLAGDFTWIGDFFYDAGNLEGDSYGLTNLRAGVQKGSWAFDVSLRNAFDEEYVPVAFQPNPADPTAFVGESGAPQTVLVSVRYVP